MQWTSKLKISHTWGKYHLENPLKCTEISVVAEKCLTVLGKSICINEQAKLNIAKKKKDTTEKKQRERKEKCNWDVHKSAIWQKWLNK